MSVLTLNQGAKELLEKFLSARFVRYRGSFTSGKA